MRIDVVTQADELMALEGNWSGIFDELKPTISPFSSHEWHRMWWKYYSAGEELFILTGWDGYKLVGIAPFMLRRAKLHGLPTRSICFMENNQSFLNDFIVLPQYRENFLRAVLNVLFDQPGPLRWDAAVLNKLSIHSENYKVLTRILKETGRQWQEEQTIDSRYLVPSGTWQDFLAGRSSRTRKTLRNIQNSMAKAGDFSVRHVQTFDEFEDVWEEVRLVARSSWTEDIGDSMASSANEAFFYDLARTAAQKGWLSLWTLTLNGVMIAVEFHLRAGGRAYAMRGHYLPEYAHLSPGTFLEMQILKQVFEEPDPLQKYDMGNFYAYKRKWSDNSEPHMAVTIFNDRAYSRLVSFHELNLVPFLRSIVPQEFWKSRIFDVLGIETSPFKIKQK